MNSEPLVSNIIIFFNVEKFIQEAIESVFAQTYNNWELLQKKQLAGAEQVSVVIPCHTRTRLQGSR